MVWSFHTTGGIIVSSRDGFVYFTDTEKDEDVLVVAKPLIAYFRIIED